jgi:hypothetical protein
MSLNHDYLKLGGWAENSKIIEGAHLEHPILESPPIFGQRTYKETLERPSSGYFL